MNNSVENSHMSDTTKPSTHLTRSLIHAMWHGFCGCCPHCGEGKLFRAFLKSVDACTVCNEKFHYHRADDLPAYLTIFIVGHIIVGTFMSVETFINLPLWADMVIWGSLTIGMALLLLQPMKGVIIGLQWALHIHGFNGEVKTDNDDHPQKS